MVPHQKIQPVILSGGAGTRLWPFSGPGKPKQFLNLVGDHSLLQTTLRRVPQEKGFSAPIIVGNAAHRDLIKEQLSEVGTTAGLIILEPLARNTAPAIALAAIAAEPEAVLLVMPSDHVIANVAAFQRAVKHALPYCLDGWLVTFGIAPDRAETGYGYIERKEPLGDNVFRVARFVEKPDSHTASGFLRDGSFSWNAGIFLFRARDYLAALLNHAPDVRAAAENAMQSARQDGVCVLPGEAEFATSPSVSIDYAIMEKAKRVAVVPVDLGWSDIGSWDAVYEFEAKDKARNVVHGPAFLHDSSSCLVRSSGSRVVLSGVDDLIVLVTDATVLILRRGESQRVKELVEILQKAGRDAFGPRGPVEMLQVRSEKGVANNPARSRDWPKTRPA